MPGLVTEVDGTERRVFRSCLSVGWCWAAVVPVFLISPCRDTRDRELQNCFGKQQGPGDEVSKVRRSDLSGFRAMCL